LTDEMDGVLSTLEKLKQEVSTRTVFNTSAGKFIVSGPGDDTYSAEDLRDATVLIDLGEPIFITHQWLPRARKRYAWFLIWEAM